MLRWTAVGFWALFAALGSAQAQDFGMYPMLQVPQGEISASAYFLDHAPPDAMLVLAVPNFPARLNGRYVLHDATQIGERPCCIRYCQFGAPLNVAIYSITPPSCRHRTNPRALAQLGCDRRRRLGVPRYRAVNGQLRSTTTGATRPAPCRPLCHG